MRPFKLFNALILFCVLTAFVGAAATNAISNRTISFQGYLTDNSGKAEQGAVDMGFKFYNEKVEGSPTINTYDNGRGKRVTVFNGNYTTKIELTEDEVAKIAKQENLWIEVVVNGKAMSPRIEMIPAPYAMLVKGIKYDAVNDTVMIGYRGAGIVTANSGKGGLVVEDSIVFGAQKPGGLSDGVGLYLNSNSNARIDGDVEANFVTANQVFGAIWN
jgi:hypothetical protein